ncbi:MAG: hypothetical protein PVS3B3_37790 [Ktedonobacteraceae bacterium]
MGDLEGSFFSDSFDPSHLAPHLEPTLEHLTAILSFQKRATSKKQLSLFFRTR